jgi:hypothetical protein
VPGGDEVPGRQGHRRQAAGRGLRPRRPDRRQRNQGRPGRQPPRRVQHRQAGPKKTLVQDGKGPDDPHHLPWPCSCWPLRLQPPGMGDAVRGTSATACNHKDPTPPATRPPCSATASSAAAWS